MSKVFLTVACILLTACSYNVKLAVTPAYSIASSYDNPVPGKYLLYVDGSAYNTTMKPTALNCAAHDYPLEMDGVFRESVRKTLEGVVREIKVVDAPKSGSAIRAAGAQGQIIVTAQDINSQLTFAAGFWSATVISNVDVSATVQVIGRRGKLLGTTVAGDGNATASGGCPQGADALAQAASKAMKELMERMGERISNAPKIRRSKTANR